MRAERTIEVDISEFDDEDIIAAASEITGRLGIEGPMESLFRQVRDLASSIAAGDRDEALFKLDRLVGDNQRLREAVDIGRRS